MTIRTEVTAVVESIEDIVRGFAAMSMRVRTMAKRTLTTEEKKAIFDALLAAAAGFQKMRAELVTEVFS